MILQLKEHWVNYLCILPESGMGYQRVDVYLKNGREIQGIVVFNAEEMEWPSTYPSISSDDIEKIQLSRNDG